MNFSNNNMLSPIPYAPVAASKEFVPLIITDLNIE